jgi:hypothetical protein
MASFVARHDAPLSPVVAWERLTDWPRHARYVPFTSITVPTPAPNGVGTVFIAHTNLGGIGFDDPMEVVEWVEPDATRPGRCRLEKRGSVMLGWAELVVGPGPRGTTAIWTEDITVARLPRFLEPITAVSSRLLFARVLRRLLDEQPR